jgi:hypothetical protein
MLPDRPRGGPPPEPSSQAGQPWPRPPAPPPSDTWPGVQPQLVADRPGDGHAEIELLPRPARGDRLGVLGHLRGRPPAAGHQPVPDDPVGVILIDRQQVDPAPVADGRTSGGDQTGRRLARVGHQHVVLRLDQDRAEPVHARRPAEVAVQQAPPRRQRLPLPVQRPLQALDDQRLGDGPVPVPHPREVVDGERVADRALQVRTCGHRLQVAARPRREVPLAAAPLERRPVSRADHAGRVHQHLPSASLPSGVGPELAAISRPAPARRTPREAAR